MKWTWLLREDLPLALILLYADVLLLFNIEVGSLNHLIASQVIPVNKVSCLIMRFPTQGRSLVIMEEEHPKILTTSPSLLFIHNNECSPKQLKLKVTKRHHKKKKPKNTTTTTRQKPQQQEEELKN